MPLFANILQTRRQSGHLQKYMEIDSHSMDSRLSQANHLGNSKLIYIYLIIYCLYYYRPQTKFGARQCFAPVCHSVHMGGGRGSAQPSLDADPPGVGQTPLDADPTWMQTPWGWADHPGCRPPLEADPNSEVGQRLGRGLDAEAPPPPIRSKSGRYASYWNAYLF